MSENTIETTPSPAETLDAEFAAIGIHLQLSNNEKIALICDEDREAYQEAQRLGLIERLKSMRTELAAHLRQHGRELYVTANPAQI